jgi:hypothetical protein
VASVFERRTGVVYTRRSILQHLYCHCAQNFASRVCETYEDMEYDSSFNFSVSAIKLSESQSIYQSNECTCIEVN